MLTLTGCSSEAIVFVQPIHNVTQMTTKEDTEKYSQRLERYFQHKESQTPLHYFNQIHMIYLMHIYTISATCFGVPYTICRKTVLLAQNHLLFIRLLCLLHWIRHRIQNTQFCRFIKLVTVMITIF
jgi:hypothetical protein